MMNGAYVKLWRMWSQASKSRIRSIPLKITAIFKKVKIFVYLEVNDNSRYLTTRVVIAFKIVFNILEFFPSFWIIKTSVN